MSRPPARRSLGIDRGLTHRRATLHLKQEPKPVSGTADGGVSHGDGLRLTGAASARRERDLSDERSRFPADLRLLRQRDVLLGMRTRGRGFGLSLRRRRARVRGGLERRLVFEIRFRVLRARRRRAHSVPEHGRQRARFECGRGG